MGRAPQALARLLVEIPVIAGGGLRSGVHRAALLSLFDEILQQVLSTAPGSEVHLGRVKTLSPCKGGRVKTGHIWAGEDCAFPGVHWTSLESSALLGRCGPTAQHAVSIITRVSSGTSPLPHA